MPLDLAALRAKLERGNGQEFWRSLEEIADTPEFQTYLEDEFPGRSEEWKKPVHRREWLRLMGATLGLAGLTACTKQPNELIVPAVKAPEELIWGRPLFYATSMPFHGGALGLLVESREGRPIKIEGNDLHPETHGSTNVFAQASTYTLYDPDRSQTVLNKGQISSWGRFLGEMGRIRANFGGTRGAGVHILTETLQSPSVAAQIRALQAANPELVWHQYDPVSRNNAQAGANLAFGRPVNALYHFDRADVVVSLDSDFLFFQPGHLRYSYDFIQHRRAESAPNYNRLYTVEPMPSLTGTMSDHRMPLRGAEVEPFARELARRVGVNVASGNAPARAAKMLEAIAADLQASRGRGLVIAGETQPPIVHALAHAMNQALGNAGTTVTYTDPVDAQVEDGVQSLKALTAAMQAGQVQTLLMLDTNPVYHAPADLGFAEHLAHVPLRVHLGLYEDETAQVSHWHIPMAHFLESWGDTRAFDGTVSIIQPLIQPLYEGRSLGELLAALTDNPDQSSYDLVRNYWRGQRPGDDFDDNWQNWLHNGIVPDTAAPAVTVSARTDLSATAPATVGQGIELNFRPDYTVWDGRYANNSILQETPKPYTKLSWDNAAFISPRTAERLDLQNEAVIDLNYRGRSIKAPVWIVPGHVDDSVTISLGYGRTHGGNVLAGQGFNAYALRTSDSLWSGTGLEIRKTNAKYPLACTQLHHNIEGRDIVRVGTSDEFRQKPEFLRKKEDEEAPLLNIYPEWKYQGYAWGMAIDMNACIGCNACVVACVTENNIAVVGKDQVARGRDMHWIRIDRYHRGSLDNPQTVYQPMMCVHCEHAPCEPVCPVAATIHSEDGLNQMVYNRCVGTRYCSNNCPYKVRRFNFYLYQDWNTPSLKLMRNPEVTVRSRGVMEKCTYCIQRIWAAKIESEKENRRIRDGEVVTSCQASCPTNAIIFGDVNDPNSRVAKLKKHPLDYAVLGDLDTKPRTTWLGRLSNPNPRLEAS